MKLPVKDFSRILDEMLASAHRAWPAFAHNRQTAIAVLAGDLTRRLGVPAAVIIQTLENMPPDDGWLLDDAQGRSIVADTVTDLLSHQFHTGG